MWLLQYYVFIRLTEMHYSSSIYRNKNYARVIDTHCRTKVLLIFMYLAILVCFFTKYTFDNILLNHIDKVDTATIADVDVVVM